MPDWISAKDKPVPHEAVLCYCGDSYPGYHIEVLCYYGQSRISGAAIDFHGNVTHWMPLPEAPHA